MGKLPNGWTDRHKIRYRSVDSSGNGHRLKQFAPRYPTAAFGAGGGGGFRGSTIQKSGKSGETAGPNGNKYCTYNTGESGNGQRLNKLAPRDARGSNLTGLSRGNVLGFKGVNISSKVWGMPRSPEKTNSNKFSKTKMH